MREHIYRLNGSHLVVVIHQLQVASLGSWVAAYIYDAVRSRIQDYVHYIRMHSGTWRVGDDDVWTTVLGDEFVGQNILHIACIEEGVLNVVYLRIHLCILYGLWYVLDTDYLLCLVSHEVGDGSGTGVEVINQLVAGEVGKLASHAVEVVSLLGVGLIETLWTHLELQILHQLEDVVVALEEAELQVVDGIVALLVVHVHE